MSGLRCAIQREEWEQLGDGPEMHQTHYTIFPVTPSLFWHVLRDFPEHTLDLYRHDNTVLSPVFKRFSVVLRIDGKEFIRRPLLDTHHDLWPAEMLKKYKAKQRSIAARKEREKANG